MSQDLDKAKIKRQRQKKEKIKKLRKKYLSARSEEEKEKILKKALRINIYLTREKFLAPLKKASSR